MNTEPVNTQAIRVQESLNIVRLRLSQNLREPDPVPVSRESLKKGDLFKMNPDPLKTQAIRLRESLNIMRLRYRKTKADPDPVHQLKDLMITAY